MRLDDIETRIFTDPGISMEGTLLTGHAVSGV